MSAHIRLSTRAAAALTAGLLCVGLTACSGDEAPEKAQAAAALAREAAVELYAIAKEKAPGAARSPGVVAS